MAKKKTGDDDAEDYSPSVAGKKAVDRIIGGKSFEQWRSEIVESVLEKVNPAAFLEDATKEQQEAVMEQHRRLNMALLHLDALFGVVDATRITYRMYAEITAEKVRVALIKTPNGAGAMLEGSANSVTGLLGSLLRGETRLPPHG